MKKQIVFVLITLISTVLVNTGFAFDQSREAIFVKAPSLEYAPPPGENFGLVPLSIDLTHIGNMEIEKDEELPASYDLRTLGKVTPVENQNPCDTCWAFATTSSLESRILVQESITYDFSEQNIVACCDDLCLADLCPITCDSGGNIVGSTNHLSKKGTVSDLDDPYTCHTDCSADPACNYGLSMDKNVTGWRIVCSNPDTIAIQNAVYNYGGLYCSMYASFPGFLSYDGTDVLHYTGSENFNHAVTIVGWDDDMAHSGGCGAWIVKNSWGTGWGENGFFYIAYDSARIGTGASYLEYQDYDPSTTVLYYDDHGMSDAAGCGINTVWGAVRFNPATSGYLTSVDFWAVDDNMTYDIYVYDSWTANAPENLLHSQTGGSLTEAGYYSVPLTSPVAVTAGDEFVVVIKFVCSDYTWPAPIDTCSPIAADKCYLSCNGSAWTHVGQGEHGWDIGIRARIEEIVLCEGDFDGDNDVDGSDLAVFATDFGRTDCTGSPDPCEGDFDVDGDVDGSDLAVFAADFGRTDCP
jgi:C1A family cysteine protease